MGSAASVEKDEGLTKEKCKLILGDNFSESRFDSLADAKGLITKKQLEGEIASFQPKGPSTDTTGTADAPAPQMSKKEQWRSTRNLNLAIAKDDKDLCKEMFGDLYSDELFDSIADESGCISQEQMMVELAKLKASSQGGGEQALDPAAAAALFASKLQTGIAVSCELKQLRGLCGRVISSTDAAELEQLKGNSPSGYPFVFGYKSLHALLQCTDGWGMMLKLGWTETGVKEKLADEGRQFKLIIFSSESVATPPRAATWEVIFELAAASFPSVAARLQAHHEALKSSSYDTIDPGHVLDSSASLSAEAYEAAEDTILNARLFLRSQFDLYSPFKGDGTLPDGAEEFVVQNTAISAISGAQVVDISVAAPA